MYPVDLLLNCCASSDRATRSSVKSIIQDGWIVQNQGVGDFLTKLKNLDAIPQDSILVTADMVTIYTTMKKAFKL